MFLLVLLDPFIGLVAPVALCNDEVRVLQVSDDCRRVRVEGSDLAGWVSVVREQLRGCVGRCKG